MDEKRRITSNATVDDNLIALQQLMTYTDKLVVDRASYEARIKELKEQMGRISKP
ncbi:MAG: hypothetical protein ACTHMM_01060 [Agriterribacter sp.]